MRQASLSAISKENFPSCFRILFNDCETFDGRGYSNRQSFRRPYATQTLQYNYLEYVIDHKILTVYY